MNQTQRLIDSIRDAPHDAVIVAGMFAIPGSDRAVDRQPPPPPGARLTTRACYRQRGIRGCAVRI